MNTKKILSLLLFAALFAPGIAINAMRKSVKELTAQHEKEIKKVKESVLPPIQSKENVTPKIKELKKDVDELIAPSMDEDLVAPSMDDDLVAPSMDDDLVAPSMDDDDLDMVKTKQIKTGAEKAKTSEVKKTSKLEPTSPSFEELKKGAKITKEEFEATTEKFKNAHSKTEKEGFYAVKRIFNPGTDIAIHADFHAASSSVYAFIEKLAQMGYMDKINKFKITNPNLQIALLGDILDRGPSGVEALYAVMRLKIENPDNVYIVRGNHDYGDSGTPPWNTTTQQLKDMFSMSSGDASDMLDEICSSWPAVLFFGTNNGKETNYIMMVHGGIEPRFNPNKLLSGKESKVLEKLQLTNVYSWLKEPLRQNIEKIAKDREKTSFLLGFENCDFFLSDKEPGKYPEVAGISSERSNKSQTVLSFAKNGAKAYFESCSEPGSHTLNAIFRGHQHNNAEKGNTGPFMDAMMHNNGLYGLWNIKQWNGQDKEIPLSKDSVWTFLVSSGVFKQTGNVDTMAIIRTAKEFKDWKLMPISLAK